MVSSDASPARERTDAVLDGLGRAVPVLPRPSRIVSLVPSLTEALYNFGLREEIAARTEYCVQPAALVSATPTVGGTKTPDLAAIQALAPDLIIASAEENILEHVELLIWAGLRVYVSLPLTVERALAELRDLHTLTGTGPFPAWLAEAEATRTELAALRATRPGTRYFCPIWRRPYMVAAPETYMTDLLSLCGGENVFGAGGAARYYAVELTDAAARRPAVVLLPDEPYPFSEKHLPEITACTDMPAVRDGRVHLVDGQWVTWYGPRMGEALRGLSALLEPV